MICCMRCPEERRRAATSSVMRSLEFLVRRSATMRTTFSGLRRSWPTTAISSSLSRNVSASVCRWR